MRPHLLALLLLLGCPAATVAAETPAEPSTPLPPTLTLRDALRIAEDRAPDRQVADAVLAAARAQVKTAGAIPNPAASFMAGWSSECQAPGCNQPTFTATLGDQGAVATLLTGQRGLAVDAAEQGLKGAEGIRRDAARNLAFLVKQQFVAAAVAGRSLKVAREEAALAGQTVDLARKRYESGAISDADVARLEVLHLQMEQLADRAQQSYDQARALLAQLLGVREPGPAFEIDPGPTATAIPPAPLAASTLASLTEEARHDRPDLAAARAQVESTRSLAALARRQVIPLFQLQAQYQQQGSSSGGWFTPPTASVGLSLPLPVLYQQQGQIGQADAAVMLAEATSAKVESQVVGDVAAAYAAYQASRSAARRAEDRLLARSRDARDLVQIQYAKGAASLLDYLDAQRTHLSNELDYLSSLGAFWTSVFQLEQAVGTSYVP